MDMTKDESFEDGFLLLLYAIWMQDFRILALNNFLAMRD